MTIVLTHPAGHVTILPNITGVAVSVDQQLMLVLPNGHLITREADRWEDIHVRRDSAKAAKAAKQPSQLEV